MASEAVETETELAAEPVAASVEDAFADEVRRNLRRNYVAHLGHGLFGQTGFRLVTTPTFIPPYVTRSRAARPSGSASRARRRRSASVSRRSSPRR